MNIAIFTNNYLPNPYGVTGSIESFRKGLEKEGHTVYVFAPEWKGYQDDNPRVFRYPAIMTNIKIKFPIPVLFSRKMDRILERLDLDIIHSQHPNLLGSVAAKWARRKKIPLVFTWHTLYDKYVGFVPFIPEKLASKWIIKKAAKYANKADGVVVPTDSVKSVIRRWGVRNANIGVIPTGVRKRFFEGADGSRIRRKFGIGSDEVVFVTVSRLTSEKNIEFLLEKILSVLKERKKVKYLLAGGGYLKDKLKEKVKKTGFSDRVIFVGEVKREEIKNYYVAGDIFVYASKSETQGMIFCEAMFAGLPIVALKATGAQDIIRDKKTGFLSSESGFENDIKSLIDDRKLRESLSADAKRVAFSEYTSEVSTRKMVNYYEALKYKEQGKTK